MINREVYKKLKIWKDSPNRKPLVLRGARQVGKTTVVDHFGKSFDIYISLNLELKADRDLFLKEYDIEALISAIFFHKNIIRQDHQSVLIFIDEIQNAKEAMAILRYFYEKVKNIHVIAAGSLLETIIDKNVSFPVGRVEYEYMYPLTFSEFLLAIDEKVALQEMEKIPCAPFIHDKMLKLFHQYTLIGGMPEVVSRYIETQDILQTNKVYADLMTAYMDDAEKYARSENAAKYIRHAIEYAPLNAGQRIKYQGFGSSNYKSRDMSEALHTIQKAMLIKLLNPTSAVKPPLTANLNKSPKLLFLDTGLVNFSAGLQKYFFDIKDLSSIYQGRILEHIIGQALTALDLSGNQKLLFWTRESASSSAEIDYVIQIDQFIIPIETKVGKSGTLRSLHQFMEKVEHPYAVRLYAGKLSVDKLNLPSGKQYMLLNLPYYLVDKIYDYIKTLVFGNNLESEARP